MVEKFVQLAGREKREEREKRGKRKGREERKRGKEERKGKEEGEHLMTTQLTAHP